jgi:ATP-binding cassette, subfamily C (CFTR/MRP), member 1
MTTQFRAIACSLIYNSLMSTREDSNQTDVITLVSTDVDRLTGSISQLVGAWALLIEVGLGLWLLWRQLGAVSIAPLVVVILCFGGQTFVSKSIPAKQKVWIEAIGRRVKFTSNLLRSMKSVKLAGLVELTADFLQNERVRELSLASKARWFMVWQNLVGKWPDCMLLSRELN